MSFKSYLVIVLSLSLHFAFSQKKNEITLAEKEIAKSLKEQYKDESIAILESNVTLTFDFDNRNNKVTAKISEVKNLINLDSRSDIQFYTFYNDQSEIEEFSFEYKNNKRARYYVKDEAYKDDDLFLIDTRVMFTNISFPFQGFRYFNTTIKNFFDVKYLTNIYFTDDYPVVKKNIKIIVPDWLDVELKEMNFDDFGIKLDKKQIDDTTIYSYSVENLEARFKENYMPGPSYIYPHLLLIAKSYTLKDTKKTLFNSTKDLYKWYKSLTDDLKNNNYSFKSKVAELTKDAKTDEEKIKNIYYWVQDNIRYIAFEDGIAGFKPDEASSVFDKKYGDCKGMANLTKQMLIEAGFDARLTWIGTKRIAYDYSIPSLSVDNHMICTLFKDGKTIYLDGTEKFSPYMQYANRIQGKEVMIEDGDNYIINKVPETSSDYNQEIINYDLKIENETIIGKVSKMFKGESKSELLYYFNTIKSDKKDQFLEYYLNNGDNNMTLNNIVTSDLSNREKDITIDYNFTLKNAVSSFDDDIYIDLNFDKQLSHYDFKERKTDFVLSSKKNLNSTITLKIPKGYKAKDIPQNIILKGDSYDIEIVFNIDNNVLIYSKKIKIKDIIKKKDFESWSIFIDQLNSLYNQQIILTRQ